MIQQTRVQILNEQSPKTRKYVLYWMQASHRTTCNHALEYAIREANERGKPLVAFFGLTNDFPEANARHYAFMLDGLREAKRHLESRGVQMVVQKTAPDTGAIEMSREACCVIVDRGYTRPLRSWRERAAQKIDCPLIQVESDAVVPTAEVSQKEEYAARTIRPKIHRKLKDYLKPLKESDPRKDSLSLKFDSFDIEDTQTAIKALNVDQSVKPVSSFRGGASRALGLLENFLDKKLKRYDTDRNDPNLDGISHMSPYLHYGQLSPLQIALRMQRRKGDGVAAYLEELIIRRELSLNFVLHNPRYDQFFGLPDWCQRTLIEHERDKREYIYSLEEFEAGRTHDPYWNAAQLEMVHSGKMHNYMRMYWGKKIIEWTKKPADGFRIALHLNNKYELDGRDPNSYTGVAWCLGKHDRPWTERPIFGKIRYMNANGLRRKFDAEAYVKKIEQIRNIPLE